MRHSSTDFMISHALLKGMAYTLALAAASSANAGSAASASFSNFTFTLEDLNPDDNIAPSLTWSIDPNSQLVSYVDGQIYVSGSGLTEHNFKTGNSNLSSISDVANTASSNASAYLINQGQAGVKLLASGHTDDANETFNADAVVGGNSFGNFYYGSDFHPLNFTLSPYTSVTFSADIELTVSTNDASYYAGARAGLIATDISQGINNQNDSRADAFLTSQEGGFVSVLDYYTLQGGGYGLFDSSLIGSLFSTTVFAKIDNNSDSNSHGYLKEFASVYSGHYVDAVPEPETFALMLAGFGLVGFSAHRRQPNINV